MQFLSKNKINIKKKSSITINKNKFYLNLEKSINKKQCYRIFIKNNLNYN